MKQSKLLLIVTLILILGTAGVVGYSFLKRGGFGESLKADINDKDTTADLDSAKKGGQLLSAFFGLDNNLPTLSAFRICAAAAKADGMPVIFDSEVDVDSLQAGDFRVISKSGKLGKVDCVTLQPAGDNGELRTSLLVGEFGTAKSDEPDSVEIIGNLFSKDKLINFQGAKIDVTPLEPGPTLVLAKQVPLSQLQIGKKGGPWGTGSGCKDGTVQAIRVVWAGGVLKQDGSEVGEEERLQYRITIEGDQGVLRQVSPFALGDLDDGDNNHLLCLDLRGRPITVSFPSERLVDPNGDLNPATSIGVRAQ